MDYRYKDYSRRKFQNWKNKVRRKLPEFVIKYYTARQNNKCFDRDIERKLGLIIADINNSYYGIIFERKLIPENEEICFKILLKINVNEVFGYINRL